MKICSCYTLLNGTRISHRKNNIIQISPRVNDWGLIRTGGLFQNLGLQYGGLIEDWGLKRRFTVHNELKNIFYYESSAGKIIIISVTSLQV